jgi:hypothetical protein
MEFILRFFALSSEEFKRTERERLSLRQLLDIYIKNHSTINPTTSGEMELRFVKAVELADQMFGASAFHSVSPSDKTKYVPKFSPTIFDSILIAIDGAIRRGLAPGRDSIARKFALLEDDAYRSAISQETMRKSNINLRIDKASNYLFGAAYE